MYYFAYGSNMNLEHMRRICEVIHIDGASRDWRAPVLLVAEKTTLHAVCSSQYCRQIIALPWANAERWPSSLFSVLIDSGCTLEAHLLFLSESTTHATNTRRTSLSPVREPLYRPPLHGDVCRKV